MTGQTTAFSVPGALLAFLVAFAGAQIVGGVVVGGVLVALLALGSLPPPSADPAWLTAVLAHPAILLSAAVASGTGFVATAWGACAVTGRPTGMTLGLTRPPWASVVLAVLGVAAVGVLVDEVVLVFRRLFPGLTLGVLEAFGDVARAQGVATSIVTFVCMTIVPGFSEEVFFRGLLQGSFVSHRGAVRGIALAALIFGAVHLDPPQALGATLIGGYLGWVAHRAGSIVPAIVAHTVNNALAFVAANVDALREAAIRREHAPLAVVAVAAVVALATIAGSVAVSHRAKNI